MSIVNIKQAELDELRAKAKHLDRAYELWCAAHFDDTEKPLNITRFYDLLGMEDGAAEWPDSTFFPDA